MEGGISQQQPSTLKWCTPAMRGIVSVEAQNGHVDQMGSGQVQIPIAILWTVEIREIFRMGTGSSSQVPYSGVQLSTRVLLVLKQLDLPSAPARPVECGPTQSLPVMVSLCVMVRVWCVMVRVW